MRPRVLSFAAVIAAALVGSAACGPTSAKPADAGPTGGVTSAAVADLPADAGATSPSTPAGGATTTQAGTGSGGSGSGGSGSGGGSGDGATGADGTPSPKATSRWGYALSYQPTGNYTVGGQNALTSSGGAVTVAQLGTGRYQVTFKGLGDPAGVAHARVHNGYPTCVVDGWAASGSDEAVTVRCLDFEGGLTNSTFAVSFAAGSQGAARFTYLLADQPSATAAYTPGTAYDSVDSSRVSVHRKSTGVYAVTLPAATSNAGTAWSAQLTAVGTNADCKLQSFTPATRVALVACWPPAGAQLTIDSRFALTFAQGASVLGRTDRAYASTTTATSNGDGTLTARLAGVAQSVSTVWIVNTGTNESACTIGSWQSSGPDLLVTVRCDIGDTTFSVAGTW